MVGFVKWLAETRLKGKRPISSRSMPQYLSAVRMMYGKLGLSLPQSPGEFPQLAEVMQLYRKWEGERFPMHEVRAGLGAENVRRLWVWGMLSDVSGPCLQDAELLVFFFCSG